MINYWNYKTTGSLCSEATKMPFWNMPEIPIQIRKCTVSKGEMLKIFWAQYFHWNFCHWKLQCLHSIRFIQPTFPIQESCNIIDSSWTQKSPAFLIPKSSFFFQLKSIMKSARDVSEQESRIQYMDFSTRQGMLWAENRTKWSTAIWWPKGASDIFLSEKTIRSLNQTPFDTSVLLEFSSCWDTVLNIVKSPLFCFL